MAKKAQHQEKEEEVRRPEFNPDVEQDDRNVDQVWKTYLVRTDDVYKKLEARVPAIFIRFKDVDAVAKELEVIGGIRTILNPPCRRQQAWYLEHFGYYAIVIKAREIIALVRADMFLKIVDPKHLENIREVHIQERNSTVVSYENATNSVTEEVRSIVLPAVEFSAISRGFLFVSGTHTLMEKHL